MASTNNTEEPEEDAYTTLGLTPEATEPEIRKTYRQLSLKVHPDRNPNNPNAAKKFHTLNQAYLLLLDPLRRTALDTRLRATLARAARYSQFDAKRKAMLDDLEAREDAVKRARVDKDRRAREELSEMDRIREQGRRLREERVRAVQEEEEQEKARGRERERQEEEEQNEEVPALDPLDTTVRVKYTLKARPTLATLPPLVDLLAQFGPIDETTIVFSQKTQKASSSSSADAASQKKPKSTTALVPFHRISDAYAAVCASRDAARGMLAVDVAWVRGEEPQIVSWLRRRGGLPLGTGAGAGDSSRGGEAGGENASPPLKAELPQHKESTRGGGGAFSSFPSTFPSTFPSAPDAPPAADYESLTLLRLRQAERERLEREIREREEGET